MKHAAMFFMTSLLAIALPRSSIAQRATISPWAGVTFSDIAGDDADSFGFDGVRTGFAAGGFLSIRLHGILSVSSGAYYAQQGVKIPFSEETLELDYVQIPLLVSIDLASGSAVAPSLFGGPQFGLQVRCRFVDGGSVDCPDGEIKSSDLGLLIGARLGVRLASGRLLMIGAYGFGLSTLDDTPANADIRNRVIVLGLGWSFPLGR